MMAATDHRDRHPPPQPDAAADDPPRRGGTSAAGVYGGGPHTQQPTRIKSFFRQNRNSVARRILLPLLYLSLTGTYFYGLLFRDVGSGVDVLRQEIDDNITYAAAPVWNRGEPTKSSDAVARLQPRSLADVAIANAEVAWKRKRDYENYLRRRAESREERRREMEEAAARLAQLKENDTANGEAITISARNATQETVVVRVKPPGDSSETPDEYVKRLASLSAARAPHQKRFAMRNVRKVGTESAKQDIGILPVLMMITVCSVFRVLVSLVIGHVADDGLDALADDEEGEAPPNRGDDAPAGRREGGLSFLTGGREAARLRRRARATRARRNFQRFVDRLNAERTANGEREIGADTLRHLINDRNFDGNDYERLHDFADENGPAAGSIFSYIGATEAEIGRCPSRVLGAGDELLNNSRRGGSGGGQPQTCPVCLEAYEVGETVRTIPCFHTFHRGCIDPWLAQRAECPVCKHSAIG